MSGEEMVNVNWRTIPSYFTKLEHFSLAYYIPYFFQHLVSGSESIYLTDQELVTELCP